MKPYVVEKDFEYKGFQCSVIFQHLGHRCGYVNLESRAKSKYYGTNYNYIPIDVHGGLTYAEDHLVEHENGYWIGWDYAHYGDKNDYDKALEYFKDDEKIKKSLEMIRNIRAFRDYGIMYSLEMVEQDCKSVVDQLIELQGGDNNETD